MEGRADENFPTRTTYCRVDMANLSSPPYVEFIIVFFFCCFPVHRVVKVHTFGVLPLPVSPDQVATHAQQGQDHCGGDMLTAAPAGFSPLPRHWHLSCPLYDGVSSLPASPQLRFRICVFFSGTQKSSSHFSFPSITKHLSRCRSHVRSSPTALGRPCSLMCYLSPDHSALHKIAATQPRLSPLRAGTILLISLGPVPGMY